MWNYIQLIGRVTKDVELKKVGGYDMATFSLAQNRKVKDKEIAMYFDCKAWNKTGERAGKLKKGELVVVQGRLEQEQWEDNHGNKKSKHVVNVQSILVIPKGQSQEDALQEEVVADGWKADLGDPIF